MKASSKGLLTQISQFWNLLDDLAESDPDRYKNFIQQELKDGKQLCVKPKPHLCLQTKILKPKEKTLFINLCQWERIPAPESTVHPVPISVGRPEDFSQASDAYTVIDVAYNPGVLQAAEKDQVLKDQLIKMAMQCLEERFQFTLSYSYHVTKFRIKGSLQRMKENLMGIHSDFTDFKEKAKTENTLEKIRSSSVSQPNCVTQLLLPKKHVSGKAQCLIEEISSTEIQVEVKKPDYELKVVKDQNEKPLKIKLKVELPGINSVSLCDLSVSEKLMTEEAKLNISRTGNPRKSHAGWMDGWTDGRTDVDLLIEVSEKYRLHLNLPESVDTEMTTAKFLKDKSALIITMPLI